MFVLVVIAALAPDGQSDHVITRPQPPRTETVQRLGLKKQWHAYVPMAGGRDCVAHAQAFDGQFVVQTQSGGLFCLDGETGAMQWQLRLGQAYRAHREPVAGNEHTFCVLAGLKLHGVERANGTVQWIYDIPGGLSASPGVDATRCYLCTAAGGVYAYVLPLSERAALMKAKEAQAGDYVIRDPIANSGSARTLYALWNMQTDIPVVMPPVVLSTHVVFANRAGVVYAFNKDRAAASDVFRSQSLLTAPIAHKIVEITDPQPAREEYIYVATQDNNVYCFEVIAGRMALRWRGTIHARILQKPVVAGDELYVVGLGRGLFCLDRNTGDVKWHQSQATTFLSAGKRLVFATNDHGSILVLDRQKGQINGAWNTSEYGVRVTNEVNDRLYLANHDGLVVCLRDINKEHDKPILHHQAPKPAGADKPAEAAKPAEGEPKDN
jgi:outer membrane protein assembly factor BamB